MSMPAAHAAREALDHSVGGVLEIERLEQLGRALPGPPARHAEEAADQLEVLAGGEAFVDGGVLAGEPDAAADALRVLGHVDPVDRGPPGVRRDERGQDPDGGRLAGAVRSEDAEHRARLDLEVEAAQGLGVSELLAETSCFDDGHADVPSWCGE